MDKEDTVIRNRCLQLFILNIVDTIVTLIAIAHFTANVEMNPLMAVVISVSPCLFAAVKLLIGSLLFWLLYNIRSGKIRRYGSAVCLVAYWIVVVQNCIALYVI